MMLPGTQRVNEAGHLEIGGVDTVRLAEEFGTPLYVVDEAAFRQTARSYLAAFRARYPRVEVSFAGKVFLCKGICKVVEQEGLGLDVASAGELYTALQAGFPASRISVHGNNKSPEELQMALEARVVCRARPDKGESAAEVLAEPLVVVTATGTVVVPGTS